MGVIIKPDELEGRSIKYGSGKSDSWEINLTEAGVAALHSTTARWLEAYEDRRLEEKRRSDKDYRKTQMIAKVLKEYFNLTGALRGSCISNISNRAQRLLRYQHPMDDWEVVETDVLTYMENRPFYYRYYISPDVWLLINEGDSGSE